MEFYNKEDKISFESFTKTHMCVFIYGNNQELVLLWLCSTEKKIKFEKKVIIYGMHIKKRYSKTVFPMFKNLKKLWCHLHTHTIM